MNTTPRKSNGQFPPGTSGNPKGRPKTENAALRRRLAEDAEEIIHAVIDQAKEGDLAAAKIVLDRILPPLRPIAGSVVIPKTGGTDPVSLAKSFLAAAADGHISADTASQLLTATANLTRIIESQELKPRLEALEAAINPPKPKRTT
jgi:hypothetical protein